MPASTLRPRAASAAAESGAPPSSRELPASASALHAGTAHCPLGWGVERPAEKWAGLLSMRAGRCCYERMPCLIIARSTSCARSLLMNECTYFQNCKFRLKWDYRRWRVVQVNGTSANSNDPWQKESRPQIHWNILLTVGDLGRLGLQLLELGGSETAVR